MSEFHKWSVTAKSTGLEVDDSPFDTFSSARDMADFFHMNVSREEHYLVKCVGEDKVYYDARTGETF